MSFKNEVKKIFDINHWLIKILKSTKERRTSLAKYKGKSVCIVCFEKDIDAAVETVNKNYNLEIEEILLSSDDEKIQPYFFDGIKVSNLYNYENLENKKNITCFVDNSDIYAHWISYVNFIDDKLKASGNKYYTYTKKTAYSHWFYRPQNKRFWLKNFINLFKAYTLLKDKQSKKLFLKGWN